MGSSEFLDINICHAQLNSLRASLRGKHAYLDTLFIFSQHPATDEALTAVEADLNFIENLLEELWLGHATTSASSRDDDYQRVTDLIQSCTGELEENASFADTLMRLDETAHDIELLQQLVALFAAQVYSRECYILGLVQYGHAFGAEHMLERWEPQLSLSERLIRKKELFVERMLTDDLSDSSLSHEILNECLLLAPGFRCQVHDMRKIMSLTRDDFTFADAQISLEEAEHWERCGISAERAGYWRAYGINPPALLEWLDFGFSEPRTAGAWNLRGFNPYEADLWASSGYKPEEAKMYVSTGYAHPELAQALERWEH